MDLVELRRRVELLSGRSPDELAAAEGFALRGKGKLGELVERLLGATGGSQATHDFPEIGVELKTIPVDSSGRPRESTYVCRISLAQAERAEWETSWVRSKLSHVLFLPVVIADDDTRAFGRAVFWKPTKEQDLVMRADFEELMGTVGSGHIEDLDARAGRVLQIRPKARDASVRTIVFDRDGEPISTVPRGFYLRPRWTGALLRDPAVSFG
ncbi:MAG: MutH/Sau3AI family endonuclease [Polyangiales bacterium]